MKKSNLFKIMSITTALSIAIVCGAFAAEVSDANSGPGVGLSSSSWDGQGKVYTYGSNGITGSYVSEANAMEVAPTTYESNIVNPIDNYAIDMGPSTASNWQTTLHWQDNGGPGQSLDASVINATSIYNNVGPGANIAASTYEDKGPIYAGSTTTNVDPSNALLDMGPSSSTEFYARKNTAMAAKLAEANADATTK